MRKDNKIHNVIVFIFVITVFLAYLLFASVISSRYSKEAIVTDVKEEIVTIEDKQGNLWEFYGKGFKEKDRIKVTFNNHNTETIFDDEIIRVKKI